VIPELRFGGNSHPGHLPVKRDLILVYGLSLVGAILMTAVSLGGLLYPSTFYPTEELLQSFVANDVVNLLVGLPILLGSMWLAKRSKLVGLLFWPGALLYVLYNYIAYIFGMPFSVLTFVYLVLVLLSTYCILDLLKSIDKKSVQEQLSEGVPARTAGWVLVVFGVLFTFRAIGMIAEGSINQTMLPISEIGVLIADIVISILFIAGGGLLLRRSPLGYVSGLGLLFVASMLFLGLIMVLLLQPVLTDAPFVLVDIVVVFIMGLICFIPFGFFVRKVTASEL
jgi:uncharacterized membrane protein YuzA (DUF378 family)